MKQGFTIIEVVIAVFVLGVVVVGVFGLITLTLKSSHDGQRRIVATGLANEKMEMIRNLPYDSVGTVGGIPSGPIAQSEQIVRNGSTYTVATDIRYIDDAFDGTVTDTPPDLVNTDYKQARVEVSWESPVSSRPVLLITQIAPKGIEGGDSLGTLIFQALNAAGAGVAGASVHLLNASVSPAVDLVTSTNEDGRVVIPGLPPSSGTYQLSVTKDGYTTEQTYSGDSSFTPDVDHSHLTALAGEITNKTFSIDATSALSIRTVDATDTPIGGIAYTLTGSKKTGTDSLGNAVYLFDRQDVTDGEGMFQYQGMTWDTYSFSLSDSPAIYDIKETSITLPLGISPGTDSTLTAVLVPHEELTLHVTVTNAAGVPIPDATVHVTGAEYDSTLTTSQYGQVFFSPLDQVSDYTVEVSAPSYQVSTQQVSVDAGVRLQVLMSAL